MEPDQQKEGEAEQDLDHEQRMKPSSEVVERRSFVGCGCEVVVAKAEVVWGREISPVGVRLVGEEITPDQIRSV